MGLTASEIEGALQAAGEIVFGTYTTTLCSATVSSVRALTPAPTSPTRAPTTRACFFECHGQFHVEREACKQNYVLIEKKSFWQRRNCIVAAKIKKRNCVKQAVRTGCFQ